MFSWPDVGDQQTGKNSKSVQTDETYQGMDTGISQKTTSDAQDTEPMIGLRLKTIGLLKSIGQKSGQKSQYDESGQNTAGQRIQSRDVNERDDRNFVNAFHNLYYYLFYNLKIRTIFW